MLLLLLLVAYYTLDYQELVAGYIEQTSERTLEAFAIARAINAVISVIQDAEIGFTMLASITVSPGEILDPVNDLIERFSLVMLVAATAFWILRLLNGLLLDPNLIWGISIAFITGFFLVRSRGQTWLTLSGEYLSRISSGMTMVFSF